MIKFKINDYTLINVNSLQEKEVIDYGVRMVGAPLEWKETMGEGIKVGVIDTGICETHPDLKGRIRDGINFTSESPSDISDYNGHGSHVSGLIAAEKNGFGVVGVAPKANLYIAKAFDKSGRTQYPAIENSIRWLMDKKVDIINMSFSSAFTSPRYSRMISALHSQGITIICAVGNEGDKGINNIGYPANFKETIAVSAVDINKNIADFSSKSSAAEISAAGINIYSTYLDDGYATLSGTSMATPIITGAAAILQAKGIMRYNRRLTPDEIRLLLNIYTEDLSGLGRDDSYGYGLFSFGRIDGSDYVNEQIERNIYKRKDALSSKMIDLVVAMLMK
ncbi:MAG: S8 family peptidase [Clostridia bacterium]|nr:S8 family peptidase [Clostridia bacterium]